MKVWRRRNGDVLHLADGLKPDELCMGPLIGAWVMDNPIYEILGGGTRPPHFTFSFGVSVDGAPARIGFVTRKAA